MARADRKPRNNLVRLSLIAIAIGVVTGLVSILFRLLIALIHNLFFLGTLSLEEHGHQLTPVGAWGPWIILAPVIGGLGVVFLVRTFAPEARGGGVPEVMDAIYYQEGRVRPAVAVVKSLASALSIGSGASVGREGPIIQIGSSFGSSVAQALGLEPWQRVTLLACGAGSGIAATFNTPLGGVMFAIELMMPEVSTRTFLPVVLATGTATYIGRLFFGAEPEFIIAFAALPELEPLNAARLAGFIGLGLLCGVGAFLFVRLLALLDDWFPRLIRNDYLQHALGMAVVGAMMYGLSLAYGHYFIEGVGYPAIQGILDGELTAVSLLAVLFVAKLLATAISLGSGAAGGIFSPSLFLGASLGGLLGAVLGQLYPEAGFTVTEYAIVGMAAMVGGATGAAMTAIVTIFELTRDYNIIVPMIVATALAIGVRRAFSAENIYTIKLAARGHYIPQERHINMFLVRHADEVMDEHVGYLPDHLDRATALAQVEAMDPIPGFIVLCHGTHIAGVTSHEALATHAEEGEGAAEAGIPHLPYVLARSEDILNDVMKRLSREDIRVALVVEGEGIPRVHDVGGVISPDNVGHEVLRHFQNRQDPRPGAAAPDGR